MFIRPPSARCGDRASISAGTGAEHDDIVEPLAAGQLGDRLSTASCPSSTGFTKTISMPFSRTQSRRRWPSGSPGGRCPRPCTRIFFGPFFIFAARCTCIWPIGPAPPTNHAVPPGFSSLSRLFA